MQSHFRANSLTSGEHHTVDDSSSLRQVVLFTLQDHGFQVVEVSDGTEALELAKSQHVDLVNADFNMPNMDGISLCKALHELPAQPAECANLLTPTN